MASERLAASSIERTAADLKSASGLRSSAAENWRTSSSRERVSVSATASFTRFWTDTELPSPKRRSSSRASCPSLSPNTSANLLLEELGDRARLVGELDLHLLGGLLELGAHELGVGAGLLAVEHAGADLHGVAHRLDGVVAVLLALAHQPHGAVVLDHEAVDHEPVADGADVGLSEGGCCFHELWGRTLGVRT